MFEYIKGTVTQIQDGFVVVEACGVGYLLHCSFNTQKALTEGDEQKIYVHMHTPQDSVALYGFAKPDEREMFRRLISVSRVGPKLALSVLSTLSVHDVMTAILTENAAAFDRVSGMGKKTASRVLLELRENADMSALSNALGNGENVTASDIRSEAVAALVSLGYDGVNAGNAVASIPDCDNVEQLITQALRALAKR